MLGGRYCVQGRKRGQAMGRNLETSSRPQGIRCPASWRLKKRCLPAVLRRGTTVWGPRTLCPPRTS